MAVIDKPQYSTRSISPGSRQVFNVRPVTEVSESMANIPNTSYTVASAFKELAQAAEQNQELIEQSTKTANKLQANQLITAKLKDTIKNQKLLAEHLNNTPPENLKLSDVIKNFSEINSDGVNNFFIGEKGDVHITPMQLPDGLNAEVTEMVTNHFISEDANLFNNIIKQSSTIQTNQTKAILAEQSENFGVRINEILAGQVTQEGSITHNKDYGELTNVIAKRNAKKQGISVKDLQEKSIKSSTSTFIQEALQDMFSKIDELAILGTWNNSTVRTAKRNAIQIVLEKQFDADALKNEDQAVEQAQKGEYTYTTKIKDATGKENDVTVYLKESVYSAYVKSNISRATSERRAKEKKEKLNRDTLRMAKFFNDPQYRQGIVKKGGYSLLRQIGFELLKYPNGEKVDAYGTANIHIQVLKDKLEEFKKTNNEQEIEKNSKATKTINEQIISLSRDPTKLNKFTKQKNVNGENITVSITKDELAKKLDIDPKYAQIEWIQSLILEQTIAKSKFTKDINITKIDNRVEKLTRNIESGSDKGVKFLGKYGNVNSDDKWVITKNKISQNVELMGIAEDFINTNYKNPQYSNDDIIAVAEKLITPLYKKANNIYQSFISEEEAKNKVISKDKYLNHARKVAEHIVNTGAFNQDGNIISAPELSTGRLDSEMQHDLARVEDYADEIVQDLKKSTANGYTVEQLQNRKDQLSDEDESINNYSSIQTIKDLALQTIEKRLQQIQTYPAETVLVESFPDFETIINDPNLFFEKEKLTKYAKKNGIRYNIKNPLPKRILDDLINKMNDNVKGEDLYKNADNLFNFLNSFGYIGIIENKRSDLKRYAYIQAKNQYKANGQLSGIGVAFDPNMSKEDKREIIQEAIEANKIRELNKLKKQR